MQPELFLTKDETRFLSLVAQRLDGDPARSRKRPDKAAVLETIRALGCVQLDTISVVARSHETVLWSRLGVYDPSLIRELYFPDRKLIEYWVHAAAIAPVDMLPYLRRYMQRRHHDHPENAESWEAKNREFVIAVRKTIEDNGPSASRSFERTERARVDPWTWYGGKPEKQALDALWTAGELIVEQRVGFQRLYDLAVRAFPDWDNLPLPSIDEQRRFFVSKALSATGVTNSRWASDYFRGGQAHVSVADAGSELEQLGAEGLAIPVEVENIKEAAWLDPSLTGTLQAFRDGAVAPKRTTLLSPFDSLVWNRARALAVFDFDYRIEVYTPAEKRRFGYYSLPILHRGRLAGRIDLVYKRGQKRLIINSVHLENDVRATLALARALTGALISYLQFLGGGGIETGGGGNEAFTRLLTAEIRARGVEFASLEPMEPTVS